ncbi:UPF0668 protein C10orf76 [Leucoagaricus sp. SymC.cos]|nr:UPF0668 protein C10orf76 [Leucoagaricus sp. SymC.cos]
MNFPRRASQVTPKIVNIYSKLFKGIPVTQISGPYQTQEQFYAELLTLDLDWAFISGQLDGTTGDACLGPLKAFLISWTSITHWTEQGFLNSWFKACIHWARSGGYEDVKKIHALETLTIIVRGIFTKSLSGWEAMEALAGSVNDSDAILMEFTDVIADILADPKAPAHIKHLTLQVALTYVCSAGQTSLVSYFLRRDLLPTLVAFIRSPQTEKFTFEAILLLCVLANFHRSDAARLNPYLRRLSTWEDVEFFRRVNWATNFALNAAIQSYRSISDDTPPQNLTSGIVSLFTSWRPDKALSATPIDPPKELFRDQPVEAAVALLPVFELVTVNSTFPSFLAQIIRSLGRNTAESGRTPPPAVPLTAISLSSYILAHASSSSSPRALAYAALRLPTLPVQSGPRAPVGAILDCCVLWLRHNLQYKLEVVSYVLSINIVQRVLWYLQVSQIKLEYDWKDLWVAILGLLNFIAYKARSIKATLDMGNLIDETVALLEYALSQSENIFPSAKALHEFIYELIRFSDGIQKLNSHIRESTLAASSTSGRTIWISARTTEERLKNIIETVNFYENKISNASAKTVREAMRVVAREIESEGLHGIRLTLDSEPPKRVEDAAGFLRYGYLDILALMP